MRPWDWQELVAWLSRRLSSSGGARTPGAAHTREGRGWLAGLVAPSPRLHSHMARAGLVDLLTDHTISNEAETVQNINEGLLL